MGGEARNQSTNVDTARKKQFNIGLDELNVQSAITRLGQGCTKTYTNSFSSFVSSLLTRFSFLV